MDRKRKVRRRWTLIIGTVIPVDYGTRNATVPNKYSSSSLFTPISVHWPVSLPRDLGNTVSCPDTSNSVNAITAATGKHLPDFRLPFSKSLKRVSVRCGCPSVFDNVHGKIPALRSGRSCTATKNCSLRYPSPDPLPLGEGFLDGLPYGPQIL